MPSSSNAALGAPAPDLPPPDAGTTGSGEPALVAPAGATRWTVEGLELVAPPERELVSAIVRDFDGDGSKDALALVRRPAPKDKPHDVGPVEIVHYAGSAGGKAPAPAVVASAPAARTEATCAPLARLERVGPRSALVESGAACSRGASARQLYVVRLGKTAAVSYSLGIADPPGAPKLSLAVQASDRDRDGLDDLTIEVTLDAVPPPFEPAPKLTAKLAFFDRPAGPSRDAEEPEASLRPIAAQAAAKAAKTKDAPTVPILVGQLRALYRAMCTEGGAPRLLELRTGGGGAVSCGTSKPLEDAGVAEAKSFVTQGDALRAIVAAEAAQVSPATKSSAKTAELKKLLEEVAPTTTARSARVLGVSVAATRAVHPEWGPIGFEPSGKLLVRAGTQVTRVDPETGEGADAEMPAWPAQVLSPDGSSRLLEAFHGCEGVSLKASFAPVTDGEMRDVLLPIAPPLGSRCVGAHGEAAPAIPLAWSARGLEVIIAGVPLLIRPEVSTASVLASPTGEMPPLGSPRSAGGKTYAYPTSQGVLVRGARTLRVKASELEPYDQLRHCTTTDDGLRVACTKRGKVVVVSLDVP